VGRLPGRLWRGAVVVALYLLTCGPAIVGFAFWISRLEPGLTLDALRRRAEEAAEKAQAIRWRRARGPRTKPEGAVF
jgi:hypothetical protein